MWFQGMIRVRVRLFAIFKEFFGRSIIELDTEDTLEELLFKLCNLSNKFKQFIERHKNLLIAINGELIKGNPKMIRLNDGDIIDLMPPAGGG